MKNRFVNITIYIVIILLALSAIAFAQVHLEDATERRFIHQVQEIDSGINAQVGERLIKPATLALENIRKSNISCNFSCSAFVPRQVILELEWEKILGAKMSASPDELSTLRLDISGVATGFQRESYGTIKLDQISLKPSVQKQAGALGSGENTTSTPSPVLLRFVEAGRIVERSPNLPVFRSNNALNEALMESALPKAVHQETQRDQMTGSLGQVQIISKFVETRQDKSYQTVTMEGLQPALSYRFRVVEEKEDSATTLAQQVCHVPTCPADFVDVLP